MARRSALRASDADREQVADRLRQATAEGRLLAEELEDRLGTVFSARTYGQLDAVLADLPAPPSSRRRRAHPLTRLSPASVLLFLLVLPILVGLLIAAMVVVATMLSAWALLVLVGVWAFRYGRYGGWYRHPGCPRATVRRGAVGGFTPWL